MEIRKSTDRDADAIMDIFASAKRYMKENGNASQWDDSYPDRATLERDIAGGSSYVFVDAGRSSARLPSSSARMRLTA